MARIAGYARRPHPAWSGDYDEGMTSDKRPRVFVARIIPDEGLQPIIAQTDADVWQDELPPTRDELLRRVEGVDGLLTMLTERVDDELLDRAGPQLRVVSNYAVGYDNIEVPACTRRGVAVGNTAGCHHRCRCDRIHHCRHQRQRGATTPMTSSLGALGDDDVGSRFLSQPHFFKTLNLTNQFAACRLDRRSMGPRIAEREHERIGTVAKGQVHHTPVDRPGDQPDTPGPAGLFLHAGQLRAQPGGVTVASANQPQSAGVGYGCCQMPARYATHGCKYDRMLQSEHFGQCRRDHSSCPFIYFAPRSICIETRPTRPAWYACMR